ncbi:hypothetical protein INT44_006621 [Umbelopsis vinacea]|uniref:Uncharacterized protein n=1 Tax=Umbelopsis vinacea TaxID=44442 RepID=A0A8H7PDX4_9FUNG|nr:hypothetical protein INT44_006621 [Umbelopsis vinacea]
MFNNYGMIWVLIGFFVAFIFISAIVALRKSAKANIISSEEESTPDPVVPGYDARDTTGPPNPFLSTTQPDPDHRTSSTQGWTAPVSTDGDNVIIDIPPPSYQEHKKDLRLPKPV